MQLLIDYFLKPLGLSTFLTIISYLFFVLPPLLWSRKKGRDTTFVNIRDIVLGWAFTSLVLVIFLGASRQLASQDKALQTLLVAFLMAVLPLYGWLLHPITYSWRQSRFTALPDWESFVRQKTGLAVRVFVVNKNFYNAMATGVLPFARVILLGRPLVEQLTEEELKAIVLHEAGHIAHRDLPRLCLLSMLIGAASAFVFSWTQSLMDARHVGSYWVAVYGSLQYMVGYGLITGLVTKRMEYRADAFAARRVGSATCAAMLTHLDQLTGGMLTRGNITHPTLRQRLRNVEQVAQASQAELA